MIRVNLLPQKKRAERGAAEGGSQLWLVVLLIVVLAEVAGLFVYHAFKVDELEEQQRTNKELQSRIQKAKQSVKDHAAVKEKLAVLREREEAISSLQNARTGPTAVLLEVARILTPGRGPSVSPEALDRLRREDPLSMYNPNWDPRRLWLTEFIESNRKVTVKGKARDGEDVAELAKRMNLSSYFHDVRLLPAKHVEGKKTGLSLVSFELEAKVRY
jgi:type IV pilus assembly protein PilN